MDANRIFVKPAISPATGKPLTVRWPNKASVTVPKNGMFVPRDAYWLRRLQDGSVVEAKPPKTTAKKPAKSTTKE